jgi:prevent-host-death family protein
MATWGLANAKARFSEVVEQARNKGPQQITRSGKPVAVLVSMEEWRKEQAARKPKESLAQFFRNSPLRGSGVKVRRVSMKARHIEF